MGASDPTVSNLDYTATLRLANAAARVGEWVGVPVGRIDLDSIVDAARRATGLTDWGDEAFLEPMARVVQVVQEAEGLTPLARIVLRQTWIRALSNRLWLREHLRRHPTAVGHGVKRPIFVLGFPRTGTTLLQNLLALEPGRRGLQFWELITPVPVHEDRAVDEATRKRLVRRMLDVALIAAPEMQQVHAIYEDSLEECWPLFANSFSVLNWDLQSGLDGYGDWLLSSWDMHGPYAEYRTWLELLTHQRTAEQLVLKCPEHLWFLDPLLDTFPDACIVWTHRDPFDTIASYCSLMSLQWRTLYGHIDRPRIGAYMTGRLHGGVSRAMQAREGRDPARFFDVRFHELVADPADVLRRLSDHFGLALPPEQEQRVAAYLSQKRSDDRGQHRYDPNDYGLRAEAVHERFADYLRRFDIPTRET